MRFQCVRRTCSLAQSAIEFGTIKGRPKLLGTSRVEPSTFIGAKSEPPPPLVM